MKTKVFALLTVLAVIVSMSVLAQDKKKSEKKKKEAEVTFVTNMFCVNCKAKIERHISWEKGVKNLKINLDKKLVTITYDPGKTNEETLDKAIEALEFTCEKLEETPAAKE